MTELFSVCDYAVRLEDHPLVKAGEVHQVVEMFRGGYLGFAKPVGGEWNPKGWRKCDAEGWIPWSGGENPVPGQMVRVRLRSRYESERPSNGFIWQWFADNSDFEDDIIAFRLSRPASEQPVEAIGAGREEIARIIDPQAWGAFADEQIAYVEKHNLVHNEKWFGTQHLVRRAETLRQADGILAALSPASPARTPMGENPEDAELMSMLDDYADRYIGATRGEDMSLEEMLISKARERFAALAASSPSPAQGGVVLPEEMTPEMEAVWRAAFIHQGHNRRGRGAAGNARRLKHPESCEQIAWRALRKHLLAAPPSVQPVEGK